MRPLPEDYRISLDAADLQFDVIHGYLSRSYWSPDIPRAVVEKAARHSVCAGAYGPNGDQVGFARLVTDHATFGYLADVFVLEAHRGLGLAEAMVHALLGLQDVKGLRRLMLSTRDAHGLYEKLGWSRVIDPSPLMQITRMFLYPPPKVEEA